MMEYAQELGNLLELPRVATVENEDTGMRPAPEAPDNLMQNSTPRPRLITSRSQFDQQDQIMNTPLLGKRTRKTAENEQHPPQEDFSGGSGIANSSTTGSPETAFSEYGTPLTNLFPSYSSRKSGKGNFEAPQWNSLVVHLGLCALTYPFIWSFVYVSKGATLFWARVFVGLGCGSAGFVLGWSLMNLAKAIIEAATWATIIHQSHVHGDGSGVPFKDLAGHSSGPLGALKLLWNRYFYKGANRQFRRKYDKRPWSLWILYFLLNLSISSLLTFIFGRLVQIEAEVVHQYQDYSEVVVAGDVSQEDIARAQVLQPAFENYLLTWTIEPFSAHGNLPAAISLPWNNEIVYFSEVVLSQLLPGGSGLGTLAAGAISSSDEARNEVSREEMQAAEGTVDPGSFIRFPRWGIRISCVSIPDLPINIIPVSPNGFTYLFTPRELIRPLFQHFGLPLPADLEQPVNLSSTVAPGDAIPTGLDPSGISMADPEFNGFATLEHILVRLNDTFAPNGTFGVKGSPVIDANGVNTSIGYDAAVCLELYEPWVLEVYNSSIASPISTRILDKASSVSNQSVAEKLKGGGIGDQSVRTTLNATGMEAVYVTAHQNSVNQILKDNGRDANYVPSPTLISFSSGHGPYGYTRLSDLYYAQARALTDATNVLPYFAGSGLILARRYPDQLRIITTIMSLEMTLTIMVISMMGFASAILVPRLPFKIPRRGFDLYSWYSAFYGHGLKGDKAISFGHRHMDLQEVKNIVGDLKVYYPFSDNSLDEA